MVPRGARNERRTRQQEQHKTTRNNKVPRGARNERKKTTTRTTKDNKRVPRRARNGKKETTTRTTINNIGQQKGSSHGSEKKLSKVVKCCHGCRKKNKNDNINNTKQQGTTKGFLA